MGLTRPRYSQIYDADYKQSVRLATTADVGNLLATGNMTNSVDGKTLAVNDRILVKDQTDKKQNGIYKVITVGTGVNGTWARAIDADTNDKVTSGLTTTIAEGDTNSYKTFKLATPDPILIGTTELTFVNPFTVGTGAIAGSDGYVQFNDVGSAGASANLTFDQTTSTLTVTGNVNVNGYFLGNGSQLTGIDATSIQTANSKVQTFSSGNVTVTGHLLPSANVTYDLGSATQRWRTGYFAANTIDIGGATISANTSTGVFTFSSNGVSTSVGGTATFNAAGNVSIGGNLTVSGNLSVLGTQTVFNTVNTSFNDGMIYLADGNTNDILDLGFVTAFTRGTYQHSGLVRDANDQIWKLFAGVDSEPTTTIDFGNATWSPLMLGNLLAQGNVVVGANLSVSGALIASGSSGTSGQYLISTGTGLQWSTLELTTIAESNTSVAANADSVNIVVNTTEIANFDSGGMNLLDGRITFGTTASTLGQVRLGANSAVISQGRNSVAIGLEAGYTSQGNVSVAIGDNAGYQNQGQNSVAIGQVAGQTNQGRWAVALGDYAGQTNQNDYGIAIGKDSGALNQGDYAVAMGNLAGAENQSNDAIAVGVAAGRISQGNTAIAIGALAGETNQGDYSIGIGFRAGYSDQHPNSIVLNADGGTRNSPAASSFTVTPVRKTYTSGSSGNLLAYSDNTGEITYSNVVVTSTGNLSVNGTPVLTKVESPYLGDNSIIRTNATTIAANITIPSGTNGMSAGPITIASGVVVTVTGDWSIV